MNFQFKVEIKVAHKILDDLKQDQEMAEARGDWHMEALLFGQIIGQKQHIESLERIVEHEQKVEKLNREYGIKKGFVDIKEKHTV